jgi:ferredoxin-NADP reductase
MLASHGTSPRSGRPWTQIHRAVGYAFIALFAIFCSFMLLRVRGLSDELPSRLILHLGLALSIVPLLFAKVIAARYQKAARGLLTALGITIFASAFTLVAVNVSIHYLRISSGHKITVARSWTIVITALVLAGIAYWAGLRRLQTKSDPGGTVFREPLPRQPHDAVNLTLARIESQTDDAKTLRFLLPKTQEFVAHPGQFLTFEWIINGKPITRSYSICSSPAQRRFVDITPKRVANGCVSEFLNDRAQVGMTVKARGPYGRFCFDESRHKRVVMIAGGSGVTPMMAMLRYIDDLCISVVATLIYCVRAEGDVLFKSDLAVLNRHLRDFRVVLVVSQPGPEWTGWKGRLRREILEHELKGLSDSTFFLCGPPALMKLGWELLKDMKVEPSRILRESFGGAVAGEGGPKTSNGPLQVRFTRSHVVYSAFPSDNLLESCERNGVLLPSGCRQGSCGTCATKLLNGEVEMKTQEALTDELRSQGFILPCVSRPITDLTLDA